VSDLSAQFAVHDGTRNRHVPCRGRFVDDARETRGRQSAGRP
jgi:hypothetical protein